MKFVECSLALDRVHLGACPVGAEEHVCCWVVCPGNVGDILLTVSTSSTSVLIFCSVVERGVLALQVHWNCKSMQFSALQLSGYTFY